MDVLDFSAKLPQGWYQIFVVIGAILAVAFLVFLWAVVFHKRGLKQRRRRRHRRGKLSVNPTLAESGGLPPVRGDDNPPAP